MYSLLNNSCSRKNQDIKKVMSVTCNLIGEVRALWKSLGITALKTYFVNPYDATNLFWRCLLIIY